MAVQRPAVLTTLCVLGIVLGALGVMGGAFGVIALIGQGPLQGLQERQLDQFERLPQPGGDPHAVNEMVERQREFQTKLNDLQAQWLPVTATSNALNFFLSVLLVTGSILCLRLNPRGPLVFSIGAVLLMLADTASAAFGAFMSMNTMEITQKFMGDTFADPALHQPGDPDIGGFMESFMGVIAIGGLVFVAVWWLVKMGFYAWALRTLRRPDIRELFTARA